MSQSPLIILAHDSNITLSKLVEDDLITTSTTIFGISADTLKKIFNISDNVTNIVQSTPLKRLHIYEDYISDVKQVYSMSLKSTFKILNGELSGNDSIRNALSKDVKKIMEMKFSVLTILYNKTGGPLDFTKAGNLVALALDLFGIQENVFKHALNLSNDDLSLLQRRSFDNILHITFKLRSGDLPLQSPSSLARITIGFATYQMQDLLFSTPKTIVNTSLEAHGIIKDMLVDNQYNVSINAIKLFIEKYYSKEKFNASVISDKFLSTNITKLAKSMKSKVEDVASMTFFGLIDITVNGRLCLE